MFKEKKNRTNLQLFTEETRREKFHGLSVFYKGVFGNSLLMSGVFRHNIVGTASIIFMKIILISSYIPTSF